ncbi:hypothetical protein CXB51_006629 [Gossypium anomalum]|uniref:NIF system FeS cluster assembly NifU N-terminal domain-containing protein n=1 Tax=Gossypium anomalum TaxID=47600 RepID=A0A8J6D4K4_9ROSI|nr:hypothetical protein CXB51_006629 [Gossypium anomalum]
MLRLASKRLLGLTPREIPSQPIQILPHLYYENIIDHNNNPRNVGSFNKNDPNINTSLVGAPACSDVMKFQIKIDNQTTLVWSELLLMAIWYERQRLELRNKKEKERRRREKKKDRDSTNSNELNGGSTLEEQSGPISPFLLFFFSTAQLRLWDCLNDN